VRFELVEAGEARAIAGELRELLLGDAGGDAHEPDIERCTAIVREAADGLKGAAALKREIRKVAAGGDSDFRGWFLNALITDLVVQQLREIRKRRQLIIVTHNPNIVVNADADLVISLTFRDGQIAVSEIGGLQEQRVRDEICRIVEGGREAFESRYARIGERHV